MRTVRSIASIAVVAAWLMPGSANAIGRISLPSDERAAAAVFSDRPRLLLRATLSKVLARDHSPRRAAPCPSGHPWDSADAASEAASRKAERINAKSRRIVAPEKVTTQKATRRTRILAGQSAPRVAKPASPKAATTAAISCTEGCRAELAACQTPGSKKGKTSCQSMYGSCTQGC